MEVHGDEDKKKLIVEAKLESFRIENLRKHLKEGGLVQSREG